MLRPGVLVHIHDIFYPFEYPKFWVFGSMWCSWNEAYVLRAFLMYDKAFKIVFCNDFIEFQCPEKLRAYFPSFFKKGSRSIWIRSKERESPRNQFESVE